jgi:hypothetical protein
MKDEGYAEQKGPDTFLEYSKQTKDQLLACHEILDQLIGMEPSDDKDIWKEPDCEFDKLHQSLSNNLALAQSLGKRLAKLSISI